MAATLYALSCAICAESSGRAIHAAERNQMAGPVGDRDADGHAQRPSVFRGSAEHVLGSLEGDHRLGGEVSHWLLRW